MAGFEIMKIELEKQIFSSLVELKDFVSISTQLLMDARATEPMLFNGLKHCLYILESNKNLDLTQLNQKLI